MNKVTSASALCALLLPSLAHANDFPTQARVEYVLGCMDSHGGQKYENLYSCICVIDKIAENIAYDEYVEGEVFAQLRSTPGEAPRLPTGSPGDSTPPGLWHGRRNRSVRRQSRSADNR